MRVHGLPILATMVLGVLLLSGVVLAKDKYCHNNCKGTDSGEQLSGDGSKNKIRGLGGPDSVYGNGAGDRLFGGTGGDEVRGGSGKDYMKGGSGCDRLWGKIGYDTLVDESGGCSGVRSLKDQLLGGSGDDTIRAQDGKEDIISGGPGSDTAYVDPVDTVTGVEDVPNLPPVATIDSGPQTGDTVTVDHVEFTFSANETSTFECRLKEPNVPDPAWESCESPQKYEGDSGYGLSDGDYTFELRATDTDGNTSEVVSRDFSISTD
jgi:Ca2+-binding RTX toxin-like protein